MSAPLAYDGAYFKSISGILKICCLLCTFSGLLCIIASAIPLHNFRGAFYSAVALLSLCCTSVLLLAHLFQVWQRKFYNFAAVKYETYLHSFLAFLCFLASAMALSLDVLAYSLATFFGFLGFCFYAYDAFLGYRDLRRCDAATQTQNIESISRF